MLMNLIPWPYRIIALITLAIACVAFGYVKGGNEVQGQWDKDKASVAVVVARQQARVEHIEAAQLLTTEKIAHETDRNITASDDYWRLRLPAGHRRLPETPGAAGQADGATPPAPPGAARCAEADGSADAIVILEWQRWWRGIEAAQGITNPPPGQ